MTSVVEHPKGGLTVTVCGRYVADINVFSSAEAAVFVVEYCENPQYALVFSEFEADAVADAIGLCSLLYGSEVECELRPCSIRRRPNERR